jgi:hypothetical protein
MLVLGVEKWGGKVEISLIQRLTAEAVAKIS